METMRALVKTVPGPGAESSIAAIPRIGPREVLIKVELNSICGTDLQIYEWNAWAARRIKPPRIFGHEFAGVVAECGAEVGAIQVGAHVTAETRIVCGRCEQCRNGLGHVCRNHRILGVDRDGAFAEYLAVPAANVWENDPGLPLELAAIQEPFGKAVHAVMAGEIAGQTVAVFGCGPTGLCAAAVAKAAGASAVFAIEVNYYRLGLARRMGADETLDPTAGSVSQQLASLTGGAGVDVVLEMSGHPDSIRAALVVVRNGGRVSLVGKQERPVTLDLSEQVISKGVTIQGIAGRRMYGSWYQTRALLTSGRINLTPLLTHRLPIAEFEQAMAIMASGQCGKILLEPWDRQD